MCLATSSNLLPQNARDLLISQKTTQRPVFSTLHPLFPPVNFAAATVVAFALLRNSGFNFHCYTQREVMPTQKSARKWRCNFSRHLARTITKGIHSCQLHRTAQYINPNPSVLNSINIFLFFNGNNLTSHLTVLFLFLFLKLYGRCAQNMWTLSWKKSSAWLQCTPFYNDKWRLSWNCDHQSLYRWVQTLRASGKTRSNQTAAVVV